jgi:hypothetical protein
MVVGLLIFAGTGRNTSVGSFPVDVDGMRVMSVSEALELRDLGFSPESVAMRGYWSDRRVLQSCVPSSEVPGELELSCHDGEFGITEVDEPIAVIDRQGRLARAAGPSLTPFVPSKLVGANDLFSLPVVNNQRYPPVPIVVVGHFNDARSSECRTKSRQVCLDRLVVERIVTFDPKVVPTPAPSPTPTPFPSPAPQGLFDPTSPNVCAGDAGYTSVGWTTTEELGLPFHRDGHVWAAVTSGEVPLGDEVVDEASGMTYRWWGRRICLAEEGQPEVILYGAVPDTSFREWENGTRTPADGEP